jgi:chemotaxis protein CheY-P-specific phosphatase CheC
MLFDKKLDSNKILKSAFESGYSNAARSFSQMMKDKIYFNNFHISSYKLDAIDLQDQVYIKRQNEPKILLTTEIFGEITGRSYFLLTEREFDLLTSNIPQSMDPTLNFKQEFIKEVDNILTASVITELANELNQKMYGDVPVLIERANGRIEDIIFDDFSEQDDEIYINSSFFSSSNCPSISPLFIWAMNSNTLQIING